MKALLDQIINDRALSQSILTNILTSADYFSSFCAPILILPSISSQPSEILGSGPCTLIETPSRQLLVTAHHVWEYYQDVRKDYNDATLAVFLGPTLKVRNLNGIEYVDGSRRLDVAILHAPNAEWPQIFEKKFFYIPTWPIPYPTVDEIVSVVGYPKVDRNLEASTLTFGYRHLGYHISSVSDSGFVLANEQQDRFYVLKPSDQSENEVLGGMSGSPAFIRRDEADILVGFLREGKTGESTLFFSSAHYLKQDGTLDHLAIPPG